MKHYKFKRELTPRHNKKISKKQRTPLWLTLIKAGAILFLIGSFWLTVQASEVEENQEEFYTEVFNTKKEDISIIANTSSEVIQAPQKAFIPEEVESIKEEVIAPPAAPQVEIKKANTNQDFRTVASAQGIKEADIQIMIKVAAEYGFPPAYLAIIGLSENIINQAGVGDNGWSYGAYQIYTKVHPVTPAQAVDFEWSSRWTANRIANQYMADHRANPNDPKTFLIYHNGYYPGEWYYPKINNYSAIFGY